MNSNKKCIAYRTWCLFSPQSQAICPWTGGRKGRESELGTSLERGAARILEMAIYLRYKEGLRLAPPSQFVKCDATALARTPSPSLPVAFTVLLSFLKDSYDMYYLIGIQ